MGDVVEVDPKLPSAKQHERGTAAPLIADTPLRAEAQAALSANAPTKYSASTQESTESPQKANLDPQPYRVADLLKQDSIATSDLIKVWKGPYSNAAIASVFVANGKGKHTVSPEDLKRCMDLEDKIRGAIAKHPVAKPGDLSPDYVRTFRPEDPRYAIIEAGASLDSTGKRGNFFHRLSAAPDGTLYRIDMNDRSRWSSIYGVAANPNDGAAQLTTLIIDFENVRQKYGDGAIKLIAHQASQR